MAFIAGAIGIGAIGSLGSAMIGSSAAGSAADKQAAAAQQANQLQQQMWQKNQENAQPWMQAGTQALGQMQDPYFQHNFSQADFQTDPGYQFRMQQGQSAIERSAAARGGLQNGGTLKALTQYGQGFASNEYQNAYNRFTNDQSNRFGRLSSIAGLGQNAMGIAAGNNSNYANNAGNNMMGAANAQGAAGIAGANAWGGALNNLGNLGMQAGMIGSLGGTMSSRSTGPIPGYSGIEGGKYSGGLSLPQLGGSTFAGGANP